MPVGRADLPQARHLFSVALHPSDVLRRHFRPLDEVQFLLRVLVLTACLGLVADGWPVGLGVAHYLILKEVFDLLCHLSVRHQEQISLGTRWNSRQLLSESIIAAWGCSQPTSSFNEGCWLRCCSIFFAFSNLLFSIACFCAIFLGSSAAKRSRSRSRRSASARSICSCRRASSC